MNNLERARRIVKAVDATFESSERLRLSQWNAPDERVEIIASIIAAELGAVAKDAQREEAKWWFDSWDGEQIHGCSERLKELGIES